jgi:hypothetical protein
MNVEKDECGEQKRVERKDECGVQLCWEILWGVFSLLGKRVCMFLEKEGGGWGLDWIRV